MPCRAKPNPDPNCDGPLTMKEPCHHCAGLENQKCVAGRPAPTCHGPLSATPADRCQYCKNVQGVVSPQTRAWRKGIEAKLGTVELKQIYSGKEQYSPAQIGVKLETAQREDLCPWVKIGNLYVSLTGTGEGSWGQLVDALCAHPGGRHLAVLTGRHGHPEGTLVENLQDHTLSSLVPDANHVTEDRAQKPIVETRNNAPPHSAGIDIELWNVGMAGASAPEKTTMAKTRWLTSEFLLEGRIVIWAWCFSLLSLYEVTPDIRRGYRSPADYPGFNTPISVTVANYFGWVNALSAGTFVEQQLRQGGKYVKDYSTWKRLTRV